MSISKPVPVTEQEWMHAVADLSSRYGVEPLVAMLGSVTGDLTDEARGAAVEIAKTYVSNVLDQRPPAPLRIVGSPLPTS